MTSGNMQDDTAQTGGAGPDVLLRAGRRLLGALTARTARRGSLVKPLLLGVVLVGGGAAATYAAVGTQGGAVPVQDRAAIEAVVHDYILAHPEIIPEAMQRLQAKQMASAIDSHRSELETPYKGSWQGAAKPDVTLVAFMDYDCGFCRASLPDIARLLREDPGLRVVYHDLPILSHGSVGAAKVSLYAAQVGRFSAFHEAMYGEDGVSPDKVLDAARKAGLDAAEAKMALNGDVGDQTISQNIQLAQALDAQGTPLFVVGDQVLNGAVGYDALKDAIAKARKPG